MTVLSKVCVNCTAVAIALLAVITLVTLTWTAML